MGVGAVGLGTALEVVTLDGAREALALGHARDVDALAGLEQAHVEGLADLVGGVVLDHELAHVAHPWQALELAQPRLGQLPGGACADLHGGVPVALGVRSSVTVLGVTATTETGTMVPSGWNLVIPTLRPRSDAGLLIGRSLMRAIRRCGCAPLTHDVRS